MKNIARSLLLMITLFIVGGTIAPLTANAQPRRYHRRYYHRRYHRPYHHYYRHR